MEKREGILEFRLEFQRGKAVFKYFAKPVTDCGIKCAHGTTIVIRKILKFRSGFNTTVRLSPFFIIYVIAQRTEVASGPPFFKAPFADPPLTLLAADGADIIVRKIIECRPCRDTVMRFPAER